MMRWLVLSIFLLACAMPTNDAPQYYFRVVNVAADDVLNIRAEPQANAQIIGNYAHDAPLVEVTRNMDGWARVNINETVGWVDTSFLTPIALQTLSGTVLPVGLRCIGEEPFWHLTLGDTTMNFVGADFANTDYAIDMSLTNGLETTISGIGPSLETISVTITQTETTSTMVEHHYNWSVTAVMRDGAPLLGGTGCEVRTP